MPSHIVPQQYLLSKHDRWKMNGHRSCIIWFTGLSGSGKSTLANAVEIQLFQKGIRTFVLDGDNIRSGLNKDIDFSETGRKENIRRIGEVSKLFLDAGIVILTAFISPFREDRNSVRKQVDDGEFIEVFADCPLEICEERDIKGLYKKARAGEIPEFTGITSPFEAPENPELVIPTGVQNVQDSVEQITDYVMNKIKNI
jgi:adenylylsulfate kinase